MRSGAARACPAVASINCCSGAVHSDSTRQGPSLAAMYACPMPLDADGKVDGITMEPVSPLADFSYDYADLLFKPANR